MIHISTRSSCWVETTQIRIGIFGRRVYINLPFTLKIERRG